MALRPGDKVAVVAPAGPVSPERLRQGVSCLASRYRVTLRGAVLARDGYLAGPDEARAEALQGALGDPDVRGVFLARGGFGLTRILPLLDPAPLRADPKPIVGFSDGTALLAWALRSGVAAVHGPVLTQLGKLGGDDLAHLARLLEHPHGSAGLRGSAMASVGLGAAPGVSGGGGATTVQGPLVGGNLTLLAALAGTPWQVSCHGAILLVEDVGEAPYRLDRVATQLLQQPAPWGAAGAVGLGLGAFPACGGGKGQPAAVQVVSARLGRGRPRVLGLPFGHGASNRAWPVGVTATMDSLAGEVRWGAVVQRG